MWQITEHFNSCSKQNFTIKNISVTPARQLSPRIIYCWDLIGFVIARRVHSDGLDTSNVNAMPTGSSTMSLPRWWNWTERTVARYEVACRRSRKSSPDVSTDVTVDRFQPCSDNDRLSGVLSNRGMVDKPDGTAAAASGRSIPLRDATGASDVSR